MSHRPTRPITRTATLSVAWPTAGPLTRRTTLVALLGGCGLLGACTATTAVPQRLPSRATTTPPPGPDVSLAADVLADERAMVDLLRATARRHPRLRTRLTAASDVHDKHVRLLARAAPPAARPAPSASTGGSPSPDGSPSEGRSGPSPREAATRLRAPVPRRRAVALQAVVDRERSLAQQGRRRALDARSGAFARVLASMAAAAAQQADLLAGPSDGGR